MSHEARGLPPDSECPAMPSDLRTDIDSDWRQACCATEYRALRLA